MVLSWKLKHKLYVLRIGHRQHRDLRVTTHVGLVARAFGADGIILEEHVEKSVVQSLLKVAERWGGPFEVKTTPSPTSFIKSWKRDKGAVVHLTMYGINIQSSDIVQRLLEENRDILVIVGGKKVPGIIYELADYNVAIGNQPHSEVAALAVFLDRLFRGEELLREFENAKIKVIPSYRGKKVLRV